MGVPDVPCASRMAQGVSLLRRPWYGERRTARRVAGRVRGAAGIRNEGDELRTAERFTVHGSPAVGSC